MFFFTQGSPLSSKKEMKFLSAKETRHTQETHTKLFAPARSKSLECSPFSVQYKNDIQKFVIGQLVLGLASGLEAFSREPPCDSVGALAVRQTPETRGMA